MSESLQDQYPPPWSARRAGPFSDEGNWLVVDRNFEKVADCGSDRALAELLATVPDLLTAAQERLAEVRRLQAENQRLREAGLQFASAVDLEQMRRYDGMTRRETKDRLYREAMDALREFRAALAPPPTTAELARARELIAEGR